MHINRSWWIDPVYKCAGLERPKLYVVRVLFAVKLAVYLLLRWGGGGSRPKFTNTGTRIWSMGRIGLHSSNYLVHHLAPERRPRCYCALTSCIPSKHRTLEHSRTDKTQTNEALTGTARINHLLLTIILRLRSL